MLNAGTSRATRSGLICIVISMGWKEVGEHLRECSLVALGMISNACLALQINMFQNSIVNLSVKF